MISISKPILIVMFLAVYVQTRANFRSSNVEHRGYDSLLPEENYTSVHTGTLLDLLDAESHFKHSGNVQKTLSKLLRIARIFMDLANISIRLKMYPTAMKCYSQAINLKQKKRQSINNNSLFVPDTSSYDQLQHMDSLGITILTSAWQTESRPVDLRDITCSFEDGKTTTSFAIIIHVKQPIHGSRKAFTGLNNVGHTFITLIKFNEDNSNVSRSFGFYPAKKTFFSATPLHPGDIPVFKDDAMHPWDETVGKFITEKKFVRILNNLEKFSRKQYNLNKNNCTDFGLSEAIIAGVDIKQTDGRWPLGKGNNPANAGQSLLEGKFENKDAEFPDTLIVNEGQELFSDSNP
jgi:hypothetical protein